MSMEKIILKNLATNETYARKVHPFLKQEYFGSTTTKTVFDLINNFISKYNSLPSREAMIISLNEMDIVSEDQYKETHECIEEIFSNS